VDVIGGKGSVGAAVESAGDAEHRRYARKDQQIARAALGHFDQQRFERVPRLHVDWRALGPPLGFRDFRFIQLAHELREIGILDQFLHLPLFTNEPCQKSR
jgi:hypothetical protein